MFLIDLLFAFVVALLFFLIFSVLIRGHRTGSTLLVFFLVLLFATWAGGVWLSPIGPPLWGVSWLSFILVGLFVALILAALIPPERSAKKMGVEEAAVRVVSFDYLVSILIIALVISVIIYYIIQ